MAFSLDVQIVPAEYRGVRSGNGERGPWLSLVVEDSHTNQIQISVPRDLQADVYGLGLHKGDLLALDVRAVARADGNSYVQLNAVPELFESSDDTGMGF